MTETEIERLVVRLRGDNSQYKSSFAESKSITKSFGESVEAVAQKVIKSVESIGKGMAAAVNYVSNSLQSVGAKALSGGGFIAQLVGPVNAQVTASINIWREYGVAVRSIAQEFEISNEAASVYKFASEATGKSVKELKKIMEEGSEEFEMWRKQAQGLGIIFRDTGSVDAYNLTLKKLKEAIGGFWAALGKAAAPAMKEWNELLIGAIKWATQWMNANQPLIKQILGFVDILTSIGTALTYVGTLFLTTGAAITPLSAVLTAVASAIAGLIGYTEAGQKAWGEYSNALKNVWNNVVNYLKPIVAFVGQIFQGVQDAIRASKPELAIKIITDAMVVAWITGLQEIDRVTQGAFGAIFQNLAAGNWADAGKALSNEIIMVFDQVMIQVEQMWADFRVMLNNAFKAAGDMLDPFITMFMNFARKAIYEFEQIWNFIKAFAAGVAGVFKGLFAIFIAPFILLGKIAFTVIETTLGIFGKMAIGMAKIAGKTVEIIAGVVSSSAEALGAGVGAVGTMAAEAAATAASGAAAAASATLGLGGAERKSREEVYAEIERTGQLEEEQRRKRRADDTIASNQAILEANATRRAKLEQEITDLRAEQDALAAKGEQAAAEQLKAKESLLKNELEQAKAAAETTKREQEKLEKSEAELRRQKVGEEEKSKETKRVIKFDVKGLDAVKYGSDAFYKILEDTLKYNEAQRVASETQAKNVKNTYVDPNAESVKTLDERAKTAEAERRARAEAAVHGAGGDRVSLGDKKRDELPKGPMSAPQDPNEEKQRLLLERVASATERTANSQQIILQPAGLA